MVSGGVMTFLPIDRSSGDLVAPTLVVFGATTAGSRLIAGLLADRSRAIWLVQAALAVTAIGLLGVAAALDLHDAAVANAALICSAGLIGAGLGSLQNRVLVMVLRAAGLRGASFASVMWNAALDIGTGAGAFAVGLGITLGLSFPGTLVGCAVLVIATVPVAPLPARRPD
jgi:predicted MFS family arabinose efflux permease